MDGTRLGAEWYFNISTQAILAYVVYFVYISILAVSPLLFIFLLKTLLVINLKIIVIAKFSIKPSSVSGQIEYQLQKPS